MKQKIKKFFSVIAGVIITLIGLAGLALPILPGWALIFAGLAIIDKEKAKAIIRWIKQKLKKTFKEKNRQK